MVAKLHSANNDPSTMSLVLITDMDDLLLGVELRFTHLTHSVRNDTLYSVEDPLGCSVSRRKPTMREMTLLLACAAVLIARPSAAAEIQVDGAYYHADVGGQYAWSEGARGLVEGSRTDRRSGLLKVYLHNRGAKPQAVEATTLNGTPLEKLRTNEEHEVIWWRTWPNPVPARGYAEVTVRMRYPLTDDAVLSLRAGEETLEATVPAAPPSFRIETIAWLDERRQVTVVAEQTPRPASDEPKAARIEKVLLDGRDVTGQSRILAPDFSHSICPIVIHLDKVLKTGSFHTYKLVAADGQAVACTLRTLGDFLRLDMYGAGDLEQNVKLGINDLTHFHTLDREALDRYARYGLRSAFHIGETPPPDVRGHPAVYAYLLHDEPDCWDYSAEEWPHTMRIGYHAPDIVRNTKQCADADPTKPVMVTLDLTYKPANYYVYAQIPDIVQPDCYPLTIGQHLAWVREVTEVCRQSAGPRRVDIIPQVNWEDRGEKMKYRRPPFPREIWIEYLYGLGAGARGFSGYEWYTESNHHGAREYPDVMEAVGQAFRRFQLVAPLILQAHPTNIATCDDEKVWLKTLVCGPNAVLLVAVNDDYESLPADFAFRPKQQVEMRLPSLPWLKPTHAARVDDGRFTQVALEPADDGHKIVLPELDTGEVILVASTTELADQLLSRYARLRQEAAQTVVRAYQCDQRDKARGDTLVRYIIGRYAGHAVVASAILSGYGIENKRLWNPANERYNAMEWWTENTPRGGEWKVSIAEDRGGIEHTVYFQREAWYGGGYLRLEVMDAQGQLVMEQDRPTWTGPVPNLRVTFPAPGDYTIRLLHVGEGKPGGRLTRQIYVVPKTAAPLPDAAW